MLTLTDILAKVYPIIDVAAVKATIDGSIYTYSKPDNSQLKNIVILGQPISNDEDPITLSATVIINCYAKNFSNGMPDVASIDAILDAIITALEAYTSSTSAYFEFVIQNQTIFPDVDDTIMSYGSMRVRCTMETKQ